MEKKYYTPTIEEFHIGFEYEEKEHYYNPNTKENTFEWIKQTVETYETDPGDVVVSLYGITTNKGDIRVKSLDRDDIESMGCKWEESNEHSDYYTVPGFNGCHTQLQYDRGFENYRIQILDKEGNRMQIFFEGKLKNKSELKTIFRFIGIDKYIPK